MGKNTQNEMSLPEENDSDIRKSIDKHLKSKKKFIPRKRRKGFVLKIILILFAFGAILGIGFFMYDFIGKNIILNNTDINVEEKTSKSTEKEKEAAVISKEEKKEEIYENQDEDDDGLNTVQEMGLGTKSKESDTDIDGIPDGWEVVYQLDPLEYNDALSDDDEDKLTNIEEYKYKTDPQNSDTDGDGYGDGNEVSDGYNPNGKGKLK